MKKYYKTDRVKRKSDKFFVALDVIAGLLKKALIQIQQ